MKAFLDHHQKTYSFIRSTVPSHDTHFISFEIHELGKEGNGVKKWRKLRGNLVGQTG